MKVILETARLILRAPIASDLAAVHVLHSLPETDRYNTMGIPADAQETEGILNQLIAQNEAEPQTRFTFNIILKSDMEPIGMAALNLAPAKYKSGEVWYKIHKNFWNRGYATEVLKEIISFGFGTLHLHRIEAGCAIENMASIRTMEKAGMKREGLKRKVLPLKSGWADGLDYGILEEEWGSK